MVQIKIFVGQVCSTCLIVESILKEPARAITRPFNPILPLVSQHEFRPVVLLHEPDKSLSNVSVADPGPCEHVVGVAWLILLSGEDQPKSSCREKGKGSLSILVERHSRQGIIA